MRSSRAVAPRKRATRARKASMWIARLLSTILLIFAVFGTPRLVGAVVSASDAIACCAHHEDAEEGQKKCCCGTHARSDQFFSSTTSCGCGATQGAFVSPSIELTLLPALLASDAIAVSDPASLQGRLDHLRIERPPRSHAGGCAPRPLRESSSPLAALG